MNLSRQNLAKIQFPELMKPAEGIFSLPEKIIQFGTGVLLRALPDYFVDKANRQGVFNGRILVVKSTSTGDTQAFTEQDGMYTLFVRGMENGIVLNQPVICSSISRVLSASHEWDEIMRSAANAGLQIVISNTTEVGIQLVKESVFQKPPSSFPAKLLAFLFERYNIFNGKPGAGMVIIPTELLTDNGKKLKSILMDLAAFNKLDPLFIKWLDLHNRFCSSLVDRIVPGKPDPSTKKQLEKEWGYEDELMSVCEPYRLWAIEGEENLREILSFYRVDEGVNITPDITKFKELKLRLLNATHTLSCGLAYLSGFKTVRSAMEDPHFESYIKNLMIDEISPAIPFPIADNEKKEFGLNVLDRFRNPYLQHQWLSITMQYSSKLATRVLPVLNRYYELFNKPPELICIGFAAYILFTRPVKKESDKYFGILDNQYYQINDDLAAEFFGLWDEVSVDHIVNRILSNTALWSADLTRLEGFSGCITRKLKGFIRTGTMHEIMAYSKPK
ncbi:MAG: tagaturonate reductase [Bacteroidota bacterium]|nr:tagaturonate reductase [Bacteroidota bacterium]